MQAFSFAALFDMDGVLIDNLAYHLASWQQFAQRYGRTLSPEQYARHINGRVAADSLPYVLERSLNAEELMQYTEEKEAIYREIYRTHQQPTPGLLAFLAELKAEGWGAAVGTSAPLSNLPFTLDGLALRPHFHAIVDASQIIRGKPDPEIYLTAAAQLGVPPERCVVFEDAFSGIEAGLRAGMKVVALATSHTAEELENTGAHRIIPDFTALRVGEIRALLTQPSQPA